MDKEKALQIAKEYINKKHTTQPVSIDRRDILDMEPMEFNEYWCFNSSYEDLNPMRGDCIKLDSVFPFYLISKKTEKISLINWQEYYELKNK